VATIPATVRALINAEIRRIEKLPPAYPVYLFLQNFATNLDSFSSVSSDYQYSLDAGKVGFNFHPRIEGIKVDSLVKGGAAEKAGMQVNDIIVGYRHRTDSEPINLTVLTFSEFMNITSDAPDTTSVYTLRRGDQLIEKTLTRADPSQIEGFVEEERQFNESYDPSKIQLRYVKKVGSAKKYPMIYIETFAVDNLMELDPQDPTLPLTEELIAKLQELQKVWDQDKNVDRSIILDLRGNGGGNIYEAMAMSEVFLKHPVVIGAVQTTPAGELSGQPFHLAPIQHEKYMNRAPEVPVSMWVDQGCASGCELMASVLQDTGRALIVGAERTFGKGIGQTVLPLVEEASMFDSFVEAIKGEEPEDLSMLGHISVTTFVYYRLDGTTLQAKGVIPDVRMLNGFEGRARTMIEVDNPIMINVRITPQADKVHPIDTDLVAKLNEQSKARTDQDPYFEYLRSFQLVNFRNAVNDENVLDITTRRTNQKELAQMIEAIEVRMKAYDDIPQPYVYINSRGQEKEKGLNVAAMQELVRVSLDYFEAVQK
jgi:C-terminal processing protease CtpA/Prc